MSAVIKEGRKCRKYYVYTLALLDLNFIMQTRSLMSAFLLKLYTLVCVHIGEGLDQAIWHMH